MAMETTADQRTHEARLREIAQRLHLKWDADAIAALTAGADALARVAALETALRAIPEWDDRGVCVFVGCSGHTAFRDYEPRAHDGNCPRRAIAALGVTPDSPGGTR